MQISERALKNWRRDALKAKSSTHLTDVLKVSNRASLIELYEGQLNTLSDRILRMTQELMDFHLLRKRGG